MKFDIIIIGAGPAGLLAAWCLEGTGISYTVIEKEMCILKEIKSCHMMLAMASVERVFFRMVNFLIHQQHLKCGGN